MRVRVSRRLSPRCRFAHPGQSFSSLALSFLRQQAEPATNHPIDYALGQIGREPILHWRRGHRVADLGFCSGERVAHRLADPLRRQALLAQHQHVVAQAVQRRGVGGVAVQRDIDLFALGPDRRRYRARRGT